MTKSEGGLVIFIFFLLFLITALVCIEWQQRKNEMLRYNVLQSEIEQLRAENEVQDNQITAIVKSQAMKGMFDKKGE